jgi:hypothetical protein
MKFLAGSRQYEDFEAVGPGATLLTMADGSCTAQAIPIDRDVLADRQQVDIPARDWQTGRAFEVAPPSDGVAVVTHDEHAVTDLICPKDGVLVQSTQRSLAAAVSAAQRCLLVVQSDGVPGPPPVDLHYMFIPSATAAGS